MKIELTRSQWGALAALLLQYMEEARKPDCDLDTEFVDATQEPMVTTTPDELLGLVVGAVTNDRKAPSCQASDSSAAHSCANSEVGVMNEE